MLSVSVTGEDSEQGQQELREFDQLLKRVFVIREKSSVEFTKIDCCKGSYRSVNQTAANSAFQESNLFQAAASAASAGQQTNEIHQAGVFQGVNLIYAVDTRERN